MKRSAVYLIPNELEGDRQIFGCVIAKAPIIWASGIKTTAKSRTSQLDSKDIKTILRKRESNGMLLVGMQIDSIGGKPVEHNHGTGLTGPLAVRPPAVNSKLPAIFNFNKAGLRVD
jgi:hypothetical protein